jgi:hypothetical protein
MPKPKNTHRRDKIPNPVDYTNVLDEVKRLQGIEERVRWWLDQVKNETNVPKDTKQWYINKLEYMLGDSLPSL